MGTHEVRVMVPGPIRAPRGAVWAAEAVVWLLRQLHLARPEGVR